MISDGYGEAQPWEQVEEVIREKERLLQIQVAERTRDGSRTNDWEDLLNEARITIWEVLSRRPDAPPAYLHAATGRRVVEVLMRGKWYGQPSQQGKPSDPLRRTDRDSFDDPEFTVEATAPETLEAVEWGYHEGEILAAIRALPERYQHYVILRFWGGLTHAELAPVMGVRTKNMARMWTESIRPVLAERLDHLAEVSG